MELAGNADWAPIFENFINLIGELPGTVLSFSAATQATAEELILLGISADLVAKSDSFAIPIQFAWISEGGLRLRWQWCSVIGDTKDSELGISRRAVFPLQVTTIYVRIGVGIDPLWSRRNHARSASFP